MTESNFPNKLNPWLLSLLLLVPVISLYTFHYVNGILIENKIPTGFIHYDLPYYMANAREHFDSGKFSLMYGNPFSPLNETPRIYFQPMTLILGLAWFFSGLDPGLVLVMFGYLAAFLCIRVSIQLYRHLFGLNDSSHFLGLVCFVWGGGLMAVSGGLYGAITGNGLSELFKFDPYYGWWFLNYGRNLIYPTEALYHLIVFACVLLLFRRQFYMAFAMMIILSISHPFTGLQFIIIILFWSFMERFCFKSEYASMGLFMLMVALLFFHLWYYLIYMPFSEEHASLMSQWAMEWLLHAENLFFAYLPVFVLVGWRMRNVSLAREIISLPKNRLLFVWFIVSLALSNHDLVLESHQPLHFTRGYIWIPLFLLGAPTLISLFKQIKLNSTLRFRKYLIVFVFLFMVSDNIAWFTFQLFNPKGFYLSSDSKEVFALLNTGCRSKTPSILISNYPPFAYLAMVYTPMRSWYSHWKCTPFAQNRLHEIALYFKYGYEPEEWAHCRLIVVLWAGSKDFNIGAPFSSRSPPEVFANSSFRVFIRDPVSP